MEREVGGGMGMGHTCKPMAVSFQCMTKFTTNKKIKKEKKKIKSYLGLEKKNTSVAKINPMGLLSDVWPAKEAGDLVFQLIRGW